MRNFIPPTHIINLSDQIYCFEFSKNEWSQNLICIAVAGKIVLGLVKFPEETESETFEWIQLKEIHHESRCHAITFSPETSLALIPKVVTLCAAGSDFVIRIFRSDMQNSDTVQQFKRHTNYINDVAWHPESDYLASVSDDHTCIIWNVKDNFESTITFCLKSAGMSVKWHPEQNERVLVAEKNGLIHLYNVRLEQAVMSMESQKIPLMSADWALNNRLFVTAVAGGDVITWDLRRAYHAAETKSIHENCARMVRISPSNEHLTASIGRPDITLKVQNSKSQVPQLEAALKLFGGLCWHYRLPYIGVGCDRKLCFWKVQLK